MELREVVALAQGMGALAALITLPLAVLLAFGMVVHRVYKIVRRWARSL